MTGAELGYGGMSLMARLEQWVDLAFLESSFVKRGEIWIA
jgi:hypothetical protein